MRRVAARTEWKDLTREERMSAIRAGVREGLSSTKIAERIGGCSRNAVIGLAHRAKIQLNNNADLRAAEFRKLVDETTPAKEKPNEQDKAPVAKRKVAEAPVGAKAELPAKPSAPPPIEERQAALAPKPPVQEEISDLPDEAFHVHLLKVGSGQCRAPLWGDEKKPSIAVYMMCGRPVAEESPYCPRCKPRMTLGRPEPKVNSIPEPRFQRVAR